MSNTFLALRYVAFALFILFSSVICIVASLNLGSLAPNTTRSPEVDSYLIFLGALGLVVVFPVIFVELIRKNAFIARVTVEVTWVAFLWVMHLSGAAAITAITPQMICSATGPRVPLDCTSTKVLLAFTWLSTITLLTYLLGLVICTVHHHHEDSQVWRSGVRDYPWFHRRESQQQTPVNAPFTYGKLADPKDAQPASAMYAHQIGLAGSYTVEPLHLESAVERPVPPVPAASTGSRLFPKDSDVRRAAPPPPPVASTSSSNSLSLYPQHLQATVGHIPALPGRASGRSPPPAGSWPRSNPQEPLPRKQRPSVPKAASSSASTAPLSSEPEMAQREMQATMSSAARSKPSGPRTSSQQRVRPPPLDLSRVATFNSETRQ